MKKLALAAFLAALFLGGCAVYPNDDPYGGHAAWRGNVDHDHGDRGAFEP